MIVLVLTVGTANILLGYALAYYLKSVLEQYQAPPSEPPKIEEPAPQQPPPEPEPEPETVWGDDEELTDVEVEEDIPPEWVDKLAAESIEAKSLVEATAQVMRLEINKYREVVVRLEEEMRAEGLNAIKLAGIVRRLVKLNRQWLDTQANASEHLANRVGSLGEFGEVGTWLDKVLLDQQSQIESTCNNLTTLDPDNDLTGASKSLVSEFARLVNLAHQLRDGIGHALLTVLRADDRLDVLEEKMRKHSKTGLCTLGGFEIELNGWIKGDPGRQRLASALLIDIGGMGRMNRQFGTRTGDKLMNAAAALLDEVVRKNRGYEIVAQIYGQQFLFFFGDTGPRNATSAAERLRQAFADAVFEHEKHDIDVTVSCAVTELQSKDDMTSLLDRLNATLTAAKKNGGNCTMLEEGNGPSAVTPPDYQIPSRVIAVE